MTDSNKIGITSFPAVLGTVIANLRKKKNIGQSELAQKLGITASTLSRIENGESAMTIDQLYVASEVLCVKPHKLLEAAEKVEEALQKVGVDAVGERSELANSNSKGGAYTSILKGASLLPFALPFLGPIVGSLALAAYMVADSKQEADSTGSKSSKSSTRSTSSKSDEADETNKG